MMVLGVREDSKNSGLQTFVDHPMAGRTVVGASGKQPPRLNAFEKTLGMAELGC